MPLNPLSINIDPGAMTVLTVKANLYSHFKFFIMKCDQYWFDGQWEVIQEYSTNSICGKQITEPGMYLFAIHMAQDPQDPDSNAPGGMVTMQLEADDMATAFPGDETWAQWMPTVTDYWTVPADCIHMKQGHIRAVQYILKWMYGFHLGPSGTSKQICVSELNNAAGCPGHPAGHANGTDIDLNYYTLGSDNRTQCLSPMYPSKIFTGDSLSDPVDSNKFDFNRNWTLWKKIIEVFPSCNLRMDSRIRDFIYDRILDQSDRNLFQIHSVGDTPGAYHHNTHIHIALGDSINFGGVR